MFETIIRHSQTKTKPQELKILLENHHNKATYCSNTTRSDSRHDIKLSIWRIKHWLQATEDFFMFTNDWFRMLAGLCLFYLELYVVLHLNTDSD